MLGDQVPVIPLFDVVGSGDEVAPAHIGSTWVKVGIVPLVEAIVPVKLCEPHPPIVVIWCNNCRVFPCSVGFPLIVTVVPEVEAVTPAK